MTYTWPCLGSSVQCTSLWAGSLRGMKQTSTAGRGAGILHVHKPSVTTARQTTVNWVSKDNNNKICLVLPILQAGSCVMLFPWFTRLGIPCLLPSPLHLPSPLLQPSHSDCSATAVSLHFFTETSTRAVSSFSTHGQPLISFKPLLNCLFFQKACLNTLVKLQPTLPHPTALLIPLILFYLFSFSKALVTKQSPRQTPLLLGWPKDSFWFSHYTLWKNANDLIGQSNTNTVSQSSASLDAPRPHGSVCVLFTCLEQCLNEWLD